MSSYLLLSQLSQRNKSGISRRRTQPLTVLEFIGVICSLDALQRFGTGLSTTYPLAIMKTAKSLLILLASSAMLSAEDNGSFSRETYKSDAPDGRFSVKAHQEKGYYKFEVELIELASNKSVLTFDPKARFIEAAWSPDSKLLAIEQNKSTHDSAVSVFAVGKKTAKQVSLPKECDDENAAAFELSTRKHAKITESLKFHFALEGFLVEKWLASDKLVLSASGRGWWGGDVAKDNDRRFLADYKLTIHFAADGTSSLQELTLEKYDEL